MDFKLYGLMLEDEEPAAAADQYLYAGIEVAAKTLFASKKLAEMDSLARYGKVLKVFELIIEVKAV